jgi:hypothetical protein
MHTVPGNISLVVFTCEGREHLLYDTIKSFKNACCYKFTKTVLAADGRVANEVIGLVNPDLVINSPNRKGYVNSIAQTLPSLTTEYFFWLEDDWTFHQRVNLDHLARELGQHDNWAQIVYSKTGPLEPAAKQEPVSMNLYQNIHGFSANPCLCNTATIQRAFAQLTMAPKGDKLGEDGFENFLTKYFKKEGIVCTILDPADSRGITHTGYLESTPREWHMTKSLDEVPVKVLNAMPVPSFWRRLLMAFKLTVAIPQLIVKQLFNNEVYELGFRLLASIKMVRKNDR